MAKVISSLPGSTGILSRTSQLTNDGESGVSTYVELDDIPTVATTPTASAFVEYFGNTGDNVVKPKTLANVKTEIVTTAAVNAAKPNIITGTGTTGRFPKFTSSGVIGNSIFFETTGSFNTTLNYMVLADTGGIIFASTKANGWVDNVSSRFFEVGTNLDNVVFSTAQGDMFSRLGFISSKTQISDMDVTTSVVPTDVFEVVTGGAKRLMVKSTSGNLLVGTTIDNGNIGRFNGTVDVNTLQLNTTPATASGTPPVLTWNSTTKDVESVPYSSFNNLVSPAFTGTPTAPTATAGTNTTQIATTAFVHQNARPYKVYTALLTQVGTNAPTATVLENTLGGTIVWTYNTTGQYVGTLSNAFPVNKTFAVIQNNANQSGGYTNEFSFGRFTDSTLFLNTQRSDSTSTGVNNLLYYTSVEIRVYN